MFKKIYIEITNICNKNCSFCSKSHKIKHEMTLKQFEDILKKIDGYTDYIYLHVKGEPLIHNKFEDIIKLANKYNKNVNITTNGTLLKQNKEILINPIIKRINISLHSFEGENNDKYIDEIIDVTKYLLSNSNLNIQYRFWAIKENKIGTNNTKMLNRIIKEFALDNSIINEIQNKDNIKLKERLYLNKATLFKWPSLKEKYINDTGKCYGTIDQIGILSDGTVIPCCLDSEGIVNLGNIYNTSLTDIIAQNRFKNIKENFKNHKIVEELCQKCNFRCNLKSNQK